MKDRVKTRKIGNIFYSEKASGYLFILPLIAGMALFSFYPLFKAFYSSLTQWDGLSEPVFIGFKNYIKIFKDDMTVREMKNTLVYTLGTVPISIFISLILANLLNQKIKGRGVYRVIYYMPAVAMPVAVAAAWQWLFNSKYGLINIGLQALKLPIQQWMAEPNHVMLVVIVVSIWSTIGYNMVILLAGLQGISPSIYESCDIDGASGITKFFKITLPLLSPTIFFLVTVSLINAFKAFDIVYMFVGSTNTPITKALRTMVYGIYSNAFVSYQMGYACAEAVVLFIFILVVTLVQFRIQKKWVFYN